MTVTVTTAEDIKAHAPISGCACTICRFLNARQRLDADLAANYARYERGELVSRDASE